MSAEISQDLRITMIGGGNGSAALFPEFTEYSSYVTAIVSMSDDGGSTGRLSAELGVPPVGDLRNVMMAASGNEAVRQMRLSRLEGRTAVGTNTHSAFHGQSAGNILLAACMQELGAQEGIDMAHDLWHVPGRVQPVTLDPHTLVMQDGARTLYSEHIIDEYTVTDPEPMIRLEPPVKATDQALHAIEKADAIVFPAGSIYTSLLAALMSGEIREALHESAAPKIVVPNILAEPHHTKNWHVVDFVTAFQRHAVPIDTVLYNNQPPSAEMLAQFANEGEVPVATDVERFHELPAHIRCIGASLVSQAGVTYSQSDTIRRGRIRHDASVVREHVWQIARQHRNNLDNQ